jgi:long-chain acyl-CoA synthetase
MKGIGQKLLLWALDLARAYELGNEPSGLARLKYAVADRLVFTKWRDALGGRVNWVISGGAALSGDIANLFAAAGVNVLQGYGLTETSPVITYNRPDRNRAGTVGEPIPGVEVMIAEDGEILTRGPHVMKGYFKAEEKTRESIDAEGWFHTGDIGEFTPDGYLRITDRKKDLFKLSTGKYVMPQPLENRLNTEPLVQHAVVVGNSRQFCTALIFPEMESLRSFAAARGIDTTGAADALLRKPRVIQLYQDLVDRANEGMDHWSTIKKFKLLSDEVSIENGLMTPSLKVKRARVNERFSEEIGSMY